MHCMCVVYCGIQIPSLTTLLPPSPSSGWYGGASVLCWSYHHHTLTPTPPPPPSSSPLCIQPSNVSTWTVYPSTTRSPPISCHPPQQTALAAPSSIDYGSLSMFSVLLYCTSCYFLSLHQMISCSVVVTFHFISCQIFIYWKKFKFEIEKLWKGVTSLLKDP